jgi:hypothetical protein
LDCDKISWLGLMADCFLMIDLMGRCCDDSVINGESGIGSTGCLSENWVVRG